FANRHHVAHFPLRRRNIALAPVDVDMAVAYDLAGLGAAGAESHAVDDAVEAAFQRGHQVVAGDAFRQGGLFESAAELRFQHPVHAPHLLLFAELQTVPDDLLRPFLAVLPGDEIALLDGALFAVAALPFEIEFHALAPALPANRADVSCQVALLTFFVRCGLQPAQRVPGPSSRFKITLVTGFTVPRPCLLGRVDSVACHQILILFASSEDGSRYAAWASHP